MILFWLIPIASPVMNASFCRGLTVGQKIAPIRIHVGYVKVSIVILTLEFTLIHQNAPHHYAVVLVTIARTAIMHSVLTMSSVKMISLK